MSEMRVSAGELSKKAMSDSTKYNALEVGHALADEIYPELRKCIENHRSIIDENEFCIVMVIAKDPLIHNLMRRKFYAWPYLPKPRPNQSVFLYNKALDTITHRLWILPSDMVMAELHSLSIVDKRYQTMKAWCDAFYKGWKYDKITRNFYNSDPKYFWNFVRKDQNITLQSEHEYFLEHREELIKAGCQLPDSGLTEAFDFDKIHIKKIIDTEQAIA
jgi:hypothetical protein